jgi:hypothetical protein
LSGFVGALAIVTIEIGVEISIAVVRSAFEINQMGNEISSCRLNACHITWNRADIIELENADD